MLSVIGELEVTLEESEGGGVRVLRNSMASFLAVDSESELCADALRGD